MKTLLTLLACAALVGGGFSLARGEAAVRPASEAASFEIDAVHSSAIFKIKHVGVAYFFGRFDRMRGKLAFDEEQPEASSIRVVIDAESVNTNHDGRDRHVKSADFLNAKVHPEIVFESKRVERKEELYLVTGDLSLNGVTKEVTAKVEHTGSGDTPQGYKIGFLATFVIDGRDFDISYIEKQPGALGPEIELHVSIEADRK
jgi:polyisoprenoid-binding protein YceI